MESWSGCINDEEGAIKPLRSQLRLRTWHYCPAAVSRIFPDAVQVSIATLENLTVADRRRAVAVLAERVFRDGSNVGPGGRRGQSLVRRKETRPSTVTSDRYSAADPLHPIAAAGSRPRATGDALVGHDQEITPIGRDDRRGT